jgi:hypothetical protein
MNGAVAETSKLPTIAATMTQLADNVQDMNRRSSLILSAILFAIGSRITAAATDQPDYKLLNRIVACPSVRCVVADLSSTKNETERTVLYTKWLLLQPSSRAASKGLLENMPTTEQEVVLLFTLPDWHEGVTTSEVQMQRLDRIHTVWPRFLGTAVQRWPDFLPAFIRYGRLAVDDTHSDYTDHERRVCRADPGRFKSAFLTLSADDQAYIRRYVFDPNGCKPIFASEAD